MTRIVILWASVAAVSCSALAWSGAAARDARQRTLDRRESLVTLQEQLAELERFRAMAPREEDRPAAPEDLPRRVTGVIRGCGLQATALGSFDVSNPAREGDVLTRRASVVLQQVTLPQVGRFLSDWRRAEPRWDVTSVEVSPRGQAPATGGDLPLQAVVTLESSIRVREHQP